MANKILQDASKLVVIMFDEAEKFHGNIDMWYDGKDLERLSGLNPDEINDAIEFLDDRSFVARNNYLGTYPFVFGQVQLSSRGRYAYHEMKSKSEDSVKASEETKPATSMGVTPPLPIGSPFGFTDLDWEFVHKKKKQNIVLFVVMGFQFKSGYYDTEKLKTNIQGSFQSAINTYNQRGGREKITLEYKPLAAGYGEHQFNQIARDIIAADIAIFETSDLNPNVMIEMGVALTWGSRVLPIKRKDCPKPPSDISGQTWADYSSDGTGFTNSNHEEDLVGMIERAIQRKSI